MSERITEETVAKRQLEQTDRQIDQKDQAMNRDPNAIIAGDLKQERTANLLDQINPDNLLSDIEHRIRGEKKNVYTQEWEPISANAKPISEDLISNFMSFLGSILNQNTSMSNFSSDEINSLMEMIISYVGKDLTVNDEEYGIVEDYTEMDRIAIIICTTCFATLKQAMNGQQSKRIFGTMNLSGNLNENKKPGMGEALAFWK